MGGPAGQLPGALWRHYYNRKYGAGTLRFPTRKRTSPKITRGFNTPKHIRQLCPRPEKFEEFRFKGHYNISVPGAPICLGPALDYVIFAIYFSNIGLVSTRWFKYDRDWCRQIYTQIVPVIFESPCIIVMSSNLRISKAWRVLTRILCTLICSYHKWGSWWYYEDKDSKCWIWNRSTVTALSTFASYRPGYTTVSPVLTGTAESWWRWQTGMITQQFNEIFFLRYKRLQYNTD